MKIKIPDYIKTLRMQRKTLLKYKERIWFLSREMKLLIEDNVSLREEKKENDALRAKLATRNKFLEDEIERIIKINKY